MRRLIGLSVAVMAVLIGATTGPAAATTLSTTPAYSGDFPDPSILNAGGTYYGFATGGNPNQHLREMQSADGVTWSSAISDPLPTLPSWAVQVYDHTWAPEVVPWGWGYLMYYTTEVASGRYAGKQCLGTAYGTNPAGPYTDSSSKPYLCSDGGAIDPSLFRDTDGSLYLLWKGEPSRGSSTPTIWSQQVSPSNPASGSIAAPLPINKRHALLSPTVSWQAGVVEGPLMTRQNGALYLLYAGNVYWSSGEGIGYATCATPLSACTNQSTSSPWLGTDSRIKGPAGATVYTDAYGALRLGYHAWWPWPTDGTFPGYGDSVRSVRALWNDPLSFPTAGGAPVLG